MGHVARDRRRIRSVTFTCWFGLVSVSASGMCIALWAEASWTIIALAGIGTSATLTFGHRWMKDKGGVPVLVYHSVSDRSDWLPWAPEISVSVATFEAHLRLIRRMGFTVMSTRDLVRARLAGRPLPPNTLAIHLDDGYLDNWIAAVPLLRRYGLPATIFVSTDFVDPGNGLRPTIDDIGRASPARAVEQWEGYLNLAEIQAIQRTGLIDIQAHGIDHGRVPTGPRVIDHLREDNWRHLAWMQWRLVPGPKSDWFRWTAPPAAPLGTPVPESLPAFAGRAWSEEEGLESDGDFEHRIADALVRAKHTLEGWLGSPIEIFCWPQNATCPTARRLAEQAGYIATTGGQGENRPDEDPRVISRLHVGDRAAGWSRPWLEAAALYASIRLFQGNYYWYGVHLLFLGARRLHGWLGPVTRGRR